MEMSIGCSHQDCTRLATRQTTIELAGERSGGERMRVWVCNEHTRMAQPPRRTSFVQRMLGAANHRSL
jgi:hypothetical protein